MHGVEGENWGVVFRILFAPGKVLILSSRLGFKFSSFGLNGVPEKPQARQKHKDAGWEEDS